MKALILAAGEGTRLRPLTSNIPKPLLLVAGRPFLSHVLDALSSQGIKDVSILVGWKANKIKEHYGDGSSMGLRITYLEQKERMGTAHAIGMAESVMDEPFVCVNGDGVLFESGTWTASKKRNARSWAPSRCRTPNGSGSSRRGTACC